MGNGKIRLYACGGCGANLVNQFANDGENNSYAEILTTYVDTSRSNITSSISDDSCFILPEVDGSGKVRSENHPAIAKAIKEILVKHKTESMNVVVFSASGGKRLH